MGKAMAKGWEKKHKSYKVSRKYKVDIHDQEEVDDRYIRILDALRQYRLLKADDVRLLLNQSKATTYRLLQVLYHNRLIAKEWLEAQKGKRGGQSTAVHYLTRGGFQFLLRERQKAGLDTPYFAPLNSDMSQVFIRHTAGIAHSMLHFQVATELQSWSINDFKNEWFFKVKNISRLRNNDAKNEKIAIKVVIETGLTHKHGKKQGQVKMMDLYLEPDAFVVLQTSYGKVPLFHEHDRNTESEEKWQQKIRAYNALYQTGLFEHLFGWRGFRVVTTIHSKHKTARLEALIRYTEAIPHIGNRFWFIHESDLEPTTLLTEKVWKRALSNKAKAENKPRMVALFPSQ